MSSWSGASYPVEIVWTSEEFSTWLFPESCWNWTWVGLKQCHMLSGKWVCQWRAKLWARQTVFYIRQDISRWGHHCRGMLSLTPRIFHFQLAHQVLSRQWFELMSSWSGASYPFEIVWASEEFSTLLFPVSCWNWTWVWIKTVSSAAASGKWVCQMSQAAS
jgi:hypothetical protein